MSTGTVGRANGAALTIAGVADSMAAGTECCGCGEDATTRAGGADGALIRDAEIAIGACGAFGATGVTTGVGTGVVVATVDFGVKEAGGCFGAFGRQ